MGHLKRLLLVAAALAVAGFVVVAVGQGSSDVDEAEQFGWYAYPPSDTEPTNDDASTAYSSSLQITLDDESTVGAVTLVGFGLVGLSFLMTAGIVGTWAVRSPSSRRGQDTLVVVARPPRSTWHPSTMPSSTVHLPDLRRALAIVLDAVEATHGPTLDLGEDLYWHLSTEQAFDLSVTPTAYLVGQVSDDVDEMAFLRTDGAAPRDPVPWHDLAHLVGILRAIEHLDRGAPSPG